MKKIIFLTFLMLGLSATSVYAYVDCRESTGCSIEQLVFLCQKAPTSPEDRVDACKEAVKMIQEKITLMTSTQVSPSGNATTCLDLKNNLWIGKTDSGTSGEVSKLQKFLADQGFLSLSSLTGYYGPLTARAVLKYQTEIFAWDWATLSSGVGPKTRLEFAKMCSDSDVTITGSYNWDSAGMTGLPDSFTSYDKAAPLYFAEDQNTVRMKIFGTTTLSYSGSDTCSISRENVKLRLHKSSVSGKFTIKDILSTGTLSPVKCPTN